MNMKLPSNLEIIQLYAEFHTPPHVREHCGMVEYVAVEFGKKFLEKGILVNLELIKAAALLHDFVRIVDFRTFEPEKFPFKPSEEDVEFWKKLREKYSGRHHAEVGAEILREKRFQEVAEVVRKHRFLQIEEGFETWEEKIVYYADKRVKHAKIVTLQERLKEGRQRNAPETADSQKAEALDQKVFTLEKEILNALGLLEA